MKLKNVISPENRTTKPLSLQKRLVKRMMSNPDSLRRILNLWPPLRASGIRIEEITADASYAKIVWNRTWKNVNMHGVAFGGTLFSMADVMVGTLLQRRIGNGFEVWTRSASFQYLKPGRNGVRIDVEFPQELVDWVSETIEQDGYCNLPFSCMLQNPDGEIAAISHQELHVRPKGGGKRAAKPQHAETPRGYILEHMATAIAWAAFHDTPETLTTLLSRMRRMPSQEEQLTHVCAKAKAEAGWNAEQLQKFGVPSKYLD